MEETGSLSLPPAYPEQVAVLRERITDEIFFALGMGRASLLRRVLGKLFYLPANRFGYIAARFENETNRAGLAAGARSVMHDFGLSATTRGSENIPAEGPVLIISNHPGAYDSVVITAQIPRSDLTLVVSDVPFTRALTAGAPHFVFVSTDTTERMNSLREMVAHLKGGGALLLFASGEAEPDPAFMPGAAESMATWSHSIEILLRKVPQTSLVVEIASGVLLPRFAYSPITRLRRMPYHQQKLGELLQMVQQLVAPRSIGPINMHISFSTPARLADLPAGEVMAGVIQRARQALADHMAWNKTFPA